MEKAERYTKNTHVILMRILERFAPVTFVSIECTKIYCDLKFFVIEIESLAFWYLSVA